MPSIHQLALFNCIDVRIAVTTVSAMSIGKKAKAKFESFSDDKGDDGVDKAEVKDDDDTEKGKEAVEGAAKIKEKMAAVKTWPKPYMDWFKGCLKKGDAGITEIINGMVDAHSSDQTPGACLLGISDDVKAQIKAHLEKSDFGELAQAQFASPKSNKGPAAEKCYDALIDDTEEAIITFLDIPEDGAVAQATALLGATVARELKEVVAKTRYAQEHAEAVEDEEGKKKKYDVDCGGAEPESILGDDLSKFKNGEELDKLLDLCKKVQKHFGKAMAGGPDRALARTLQREIGSGKKKLVIRLLRLALPIAPMWSLAAVFTCAKEMLEIPSRLMGTALIDQALTCEAHMVRPIIKLQATKILVFFAFKEIFGIMGDIMKNRCNRTFALALKQAVFKNILRQDTEYFDKVKTGLGLAIAAPAICLPRFSFGRCFNLPSKELGEGVSRFDIICHGQACCRSG